jgi:hypothetical protein
VVEYTGSKEALEGFIDKFYPQDADDTKSEIMPVDGNMNELNDLGMTEEDKNSMSLEELMGTAMEIEEIQNYATDDSEDEKGFAVPGDDEEIYHANVLSPEWEERFLGLGGDAVVRGIKYLVDDGFELDDIIKFLKNNEL